MRIELCDSFACIHPYSHDQTQDKMVFVATNDGPSSAAESDRRSPTSAPSAAEVPESFPFPSGFPREIRVSERGCHRYLM